MPESVELKVMEVNCQTNEVTTRVMTPEEVAVYEKDQEDQRLARLAEEAALAEKQQLQESAKAKLASLGLTESEILALIGR